MWAYYRSLRGRDLDPAAVTVVGPLHADSGLHEDACSLLAKVWSVALIALPAVVVLVLGYMRRHVSDDALILTRVVRQILAGNGPVFNVGERAEASTSTLWQWLLVLAGWATRIDVVQLAVFGSLLLTAAALVVDLDGTRRFQ
jgi:arabinofuranosyltransferase